MDPIGRGKTADVFAHEDGKILKLYHPGFSELAVDEEYSFSKQVYSLGIKTPKPYEKIIKEERHGLVFQKIMGETMLHMLVANPEGRLTYAQSLAKLHVHIHSRKANGIAREQKTFLKENIRVAPLLTDEEKQKIITFVEQLSNDEKLCHGDFHPDNILIDGDRENDHWIIDWMTASSGNPAGDVARSIVILTYGTLPEELPDPIKEQIQSLRSQLTHEYVNHYVTLSGIDEREIDQWILPVAAARLVERLPQEEIDMLVNEIRKRLIKCSGR